jgi:hypothetical protein
MPCDDFIFYLNYLMPNSIRITIGNKRDFKATFMNVIIKGGGNFIIEKLKANMRELKFDAIIR